MEQQILFWWTVGLTVTVVVVLIAAGLLLAILAAAKRIERGAAGALETVKQVRQNTQVIWALEDTNQVARQLLGGAQSILANAGKIAQALHEADVREGRA